MTVRQQIDTLLKGGMSMEGIAAQLQVRLSTIYRWRTGSSNPHKTFAAALEKLTVGKKAKVR